MPGRALLSEPNALTIDIGVAVTQLPLQGCAKGDCCRSPAWPINPYVMRLEALAYISHGSKFNWTSCVLVVQRIVHRTKRCPGCVLPPTLLTENWLKQEKWFRPSPSSLTNPPHTTHPPPHTMHPRPPRLLSHLALSPALRPQHGEPDNGFSGTAPAFKRVTVQTLIQHPTARRKSHLLFKQHCPQTFSWMIVQMFTTSTHEAQDSVLKKHVHAATLQR